jgi:Zn finger protein HypA/HybF involved in hydrogenase expression
MGKGHRDNTSARKKRGPKAFAKKAKRRADATQKVAAKCRLCGRKCRPTKQVGGLCPICRGQA